VGFERKELPTFKIRRFNLIIQTSNFSQNTGRAGQLHNCIFHMTNRVGVKKHVPIEIGHWSFHALLSLFSPP
jgi:hypothetical protein